jgi:hypothetical protein
MEFFLNECSLHGQYNSVREFVNSLNTINKCKEEITKFNCTLYCSERISSVKVVHDLNFEEALRKTRNWDLIGAILGWISTTSSKSGPFWEDKRLHSEDDWLEDESKEIITGSSLAEAAWRTTQGKESHTISFEPSKFSKTPLKVIWIRSDEDEQLIEVNNFWQIVPLKNFLNDKSPAPKTWPDLIRQCIQQYTNLTFTDDLIPKDIGPFSKGIAEKIKELLAILDELNTCFETSGSLNQRGKQIIEDYFRGNDALFSGESVTNERKFHRELTFKNKEEMFCPFHGKIKFGREYRIHFNWPKKESTDPLYIVYIGPKITKD